MSHTVDKLAPAGDSGLGVTPSISDTLVLLTVSVQHCAVGCGPSLARHHPSCHRRTSMMNLRQLLLYLGYSSTDEHLS